MVKQVSISTTLGTNAIHHHIGVLPSATPAIASEIQPMERRLFTMGSRCNSEGAALISKVGLGSDPLGRPLASRSITASAITLLLSWNRHGRVPHELRGHHLLQRGFHCVL